jgi:hypothetical protein
LKTSTINYIEFGVRAKGMNGSGVARNGCTFLAYETRKKRSFAISVNSEQA